MRRQGQAQEAQAPLSAADPRERLLDAMVCVAARHGYAGASVARVVERAGASRATFYQHFSGREECFLAAYRRVAAAVRVRLGSLADAAPPDRARAATELILGEAAAHPASARLVLVESLGASPRVRTVHEGFLARCEAWIEDRLCDQSSSNLHLPAVAALGALNGAVSSRLLAGEATSLPDLLDPLLAWLDSYSLADEGWAPWPSTAWEELGRRMAISPPDGPPDVGAVRLPRGISALPLARAAERRRERILRATAALVARDGYASLTVDRIAAAAHVSRRAFYSCFPGKQDAYLAAQDEALQGSIAAAAADFSLAPSWPEAVWRAGAAMLSYMASHPDLSHLGLAEIHVVGEPAVRRQEEGRLAYSLFLERGYVEFPHAAPNREVCTAAIADAVFAMIRRRVIEGRTAEMLALLPQAAYVILAPFLGPAAAMDFVVARARGGPPALPAGRARSPALVD